MVFQSEQNPFTKALAGGKIKTIYFAGGTHYEKVFNSTCHNHCCIDCH
jgi:hypothetical protein